MRGSEQSGLIKGCFIMSDDISVDCSLLRIKRVIFYAGFRGGFPIIKFRFFDLHIISSLDMDTQ